MGLLKYHQDSYQLNSLCYDLKDRSIITSRSRSSYPLGKLFDEQKNDEGLNANLELLEVA